MTTKTAQRKAEAIAPGRSLIVNAQQQKTVFSDGKVQYSNRCSITVFDKNGDDCHAFDGPNFGDALEKVRAAIDTLP